MLRGLPPQFSTGLTTHGGSLEDPADAGSMVEAGAVPEAPALAITLAPATAALAPAALAPAALAPAAPDGLVLAPPAADDPSPGAGGDPPAGGCPEQAHAVAPNRQARNVAQAPHCF